MPNDEKDRLGDTLRDAERAREDQYFAQRDRELLAKLRRQQSAMRCAKCDKELPAGSENSGQALCHECRVG